jgi:soluble lytic murein transglycosylase-like protein
MRRDGKLGLYSALVLAVGLVPAAAFAAPRGKAVRGGKRYPRSTLAWAERWSPIMSVPVSWIMAIAEIESGYDLEMTDERPRAEKRGGAWGLMGLTLDTAKDLVRRLGEREPRLMKDPETRKALRAWDGTGKSLHDGNLSVMLGSYYLGLARREFGDDFRLAAAVYHQGPRTVRTLLARGLPIPERMPPIGRKYVLAALEAHGRHA